MAQAQRIKGQETEIILVVNGQPADSFNSVKSFDVEFMMDLLQEGFIGETSDRFDEVFKGCKGNIEMEFNTSAVFRVIEALINRARRRQPGTVVNIKTTLNFPNGQRKRLVFPNVNFGAVPMNFGGRTEYGTLKLSWGCSEFTPV